MTAGICECGCGGQTGLATRTRRGGVKGQPLRFMNGHGNRRRDAQYRRVMTANGIVKIHRLRAERALGRPLPRKAVVHHADGSTREDAPLVICQDQAYHRLLHARMRIVAHGGNPNTDAVCTRCKQAKRRDMFTRDKRQVFGVVHVCRVCAADRWLVNNLHAPWRKKRYAPRTSIRQMWAQPERKEP